MARALRTQIARYTQQDIDSALNRLNRDLEKRLDDRRDLNQDIKSIRDNIKYWEDINENKNQMRIKWD